MHPYCEAFLIHRKTLHIFGHYKFVGVVVLCQMQHVFRLDAACVMSLGRAQHEFR